MVRACLPAHLMLSPMFMQLCESIVAWKHHIHDSADKQLGGGIMVMCLS